LTQARDPAGGGQVNPGEADWLRQIKSGGSGAHAPAGPRAGTHTAGQPLSRTDPSLPDGADENPPAIFG
jgi:hypothetical protein